MASGDFDEMYRHVLGSWWKWAKAVATVESGENPNAVGDGGAAVGLMQQHSDFFIDWRRFSTCNRIYPLCQVEAFARFWNHYAGAKVDHILGVYNQGPAGAALHPDKAAAYAAKVRAAYDAIEA